MVYESPDGKDMQADIDTLLKNILDFFGVRKRIGTEQSN